MCIKSGKGKRDWCCQVLCIHFVVETKEEKYMRVFFCMIFQHLLFKCVLQPISSSIKNTEYSLSQISHYLNATSAHLPFEAL
jgi:hypothetical protein